MRFIAECGLNHNGNLDLLFEMIKQAKWAGATDVKFQLGWRANQDEMNHFDKEKLQEIINFANYMKSIHYFPFLTLRLMNSFPHLI